MKMIRVQTSSTEPRTSSIGGRGEYAPPFATAIDVVIHVATTLENIRLGFSKESLLRQF